MRQCTQAWRNSCTHYLLAQHRVNLRVLAELHYQRASTCCWPDKGNENYSVGQKEQTLDALVLEMYAHFPSIWPYLSSILFMSYITLNLIELFFSVEFVFRNFFPFDFHICCCCHWLGSFACVCVEGGGVGGRIWLNFVCSDVDVCFWLVGLFGFLVCVCVFV